MTIEVVAAAVFDRQRRILLSQRPAGKHLAGTWEFPGGKLEQGESHGDGLARELAEELGIRVVDSQPLLSLTHHYPERSVRLWLRTVTDYGGEPRGLEGQALKWVSLAEAMRLPMPAADRPMLKALALPPVCVQLPPASDAEAAAVSRQDVETALEAGHRWFCLPVDGMSTARVLTLVRRLAPGFDREQASWLIQGEPELVDAAGASGIHLSRDQLHQTNERPVPAARIACAVCIDEPDLVQAGRLELDFVTLPLDADFDRLCAQSPLPVLAAVDTDGSDLASVRRRGGFGRMVKWRGTQS